MKRKICPVCGSILEYGFCKWCKGYPCLECGGYGFVRSVYDGYYTVLDRKTFKNEKCYFVRWRDKPCSVCLGAGTVPHFETWDGEE